MLKNPLLFVALFTAIFSTSSAPALAAPEALEWNQVRELALKQNLGLRGAGLRLDAAHSAVKENIGNFLPDVDLSGRRSRTETKVGTNPEVVSKNRVYSATASLNVFAGFAHVAGYRRARAAAEETSANRDLTSSELRYALRRAFFGLSVQQDRIRILEKILQRKEQNQKLVAIKYDSGAEARWNVQKASADAERAAFNVNAARADLGVARENLARLLQLDTLPGSAVATTKAEAAAPSALDEVATVNNHPQVRASRAGAERLGFDRTVARSTFFPNVNLGYTRSRDENLTGAKLKTDGNTFQVAASWNIFNGLSDFHRVQQANLAHEAAELESEQQARGTLSTLRTSAESLRVATGRLPSARSLRTAAEERLKTVSAQYRSGLKNYLDWEQAETQLVEAELASVSAELDALNALADLDRSLGKTLEQP